MQSVLISDIGTLNNFRKQQIAQESGVSKAIVTKMRKNKIMFQIIKNALI